MNNALPPTSRDARETRESETKEQRIYRAAQQPGGYLWPQMRVGRRALFRDAETLDAQDWHQYIAELDLQNMPRGRAHTLGSVACHYITDTEMRTMILAQSENYHQNRRDASRRYREIGKNLTAHLADMQGKSYRQNPSELCERPELMGRTLVKGVVHPQPSQKYRPTPLVTRRLDEGGIVVYDGNVWGLDLSRNSQLYEERNNVLKHLNREEGLDTARFVRRDWAPHATLFRMHPHLRADDVVMRWPRDMPEEMDFGEVKTLNEL